MPELNQTHYTNDTYQQIFIDTLSVYNYHTLLNLFRWGVFGSVGYTSSDERFSASLGLRSDGNNYSGRMKNMLRQLSPRLSLSYRWLKNWSISGHWGLYYQLPPYTSLGFKD